MTNTENSIEPGGSLRTMSSATKGENIICMFSKSLIWMALVLLVLIPLEAISASRSGEPCAPRVSLIGLNIFGVVGAQIITEDYAVVIIDSDDPDRLIHALVRKNGEWNAYLIAEKSSVEGLFFSKSPSKFVVWTMHSVEGPGSGWSGTTFSEEGAPSFCTYVGFPAELNEPDWNSEYLELLNFNLDASGHGAIIGQAIIDRTASQETWTYRYESVTNGEFWTKPEKILEPHEIPGTFKSFMYQGGINNQDWGPVLDKYMDELDDMRKE